MMEKLLFTGMAFLMSLLNAFAEDRYVAFLTLCLVALGALFDNESSKPWLLMLESLPVQDHLAAQAADWLLHLTSEVEDVDYWRFEAKRRPLEVFVLLVLVFCTALLWRCLTSRWAVTPLAILDPSTYINWQRVARQTQHGRQAIDPSAFTARQLAFNFNSQGSDRVKVNVVMNYYNADGANTASLQPDSQTYRTSVPQGMVVEAETVEDEDEDINPSTVEPASNNQVAIACNRSSAPPSNQELTSVNIPIPSPIPANPPAHLDHREKLLEIIRGWSKSNKMDARRTKIKFSNKTAQDLADPVFKAEIDAVQRSFEKVVHNKQTVDMQSCELYGIKETLQVDIIKAWVFLDYYNGRGFPKGYKVITEADDHDGRLTAVFSDMPAESVFG